MKEEKKTKNSQLKNSSSSSNNSKDKKNKKKYMKNSSYYYYKNKKKKKTNNLDDTEIIDVIKEETILEDESVKEDMTFEDIEVTDKNKVKKNESVKKTSNDRVKKTDKDKNDKVKESDKEISRNKARSTDSKKESLDKKDTNINKDEKKYNDDDLIITKQLDFCLLNSSDVKNKDTIESLKQAIDMYYYEEEMGKFSIKEDKRYLKDLPEITEEEKKEIKKETKAKQSKVKKESLEDLETIIPFKSEPLSKKRIKGKSKNTNIDLFDENDYKDETPVVEKTIITHEISVDTKKKSKKSLFCKLKETLEKIDKAETITEIEKSADKLSDSKEVIKEETLKEEQPTEPVKESIELPAKKEIKEDPVKEEIKLDSVKDDKEKNDVKEKEINEKDTGKKKFKIKEKLLDSKHKKKKKDYEEVLVEEFERIENAIVDEPKIDFEKISEIPKEDNSTIYIDEQDSDIMPKLKSDKKSEVKKETILDTKVQPLIEEDKFTQILNRIDLEEKLKEIADSDENSNYLAESFLDLKDKDTQRLQYDTNSKKKLFIILGIILVAVILIIFAIDYFRSNDKNFISAIYNAGTSNNKNKDELYNQCLNREYQVNDKSEDIVAKEKEITDYVISKYDASFVYEDVETGYSFGYNSAKTYYAASTIKFLDALYVYTKAESGSINLDDTITYTKSYNLSDSLGLDKHRYGDKITIRDLVKYAISVSDNGAHAMLVDYIGKNKLREFGNELGATNTMVGHDNFGNISGLDAIVYLEAMNNFINSNSIYAAELKDLLINADEAYLDIDDSIVAAHKYGHYDKYYHNIGIVYAEHPYLIAILSNEGMSSKTEEMIRDINSKIYELHNMYYESRDALCYKEAYLN